MNDNPEVKKTQYTMLVPQALIDDYQVNLLDFLSNPYLRPRPAPPLTRRQKLARKIRNTRLRAAVLLYKLVAGEDVPEERDPYDD